VEAIFVEPLQNVIHTVLQLPAITHNNNNNTAIIIIVIVIIIVGGGLTAIPAFCVA